MRTAALRTVSPDRTAGPGRPRLLDRSLVYTAITRATDLAVLVENIWIPDFGPLAGSRNGGDPHLFGGKGPSSRNSRDDRNEHPAGKVPELRRVADGREPPKARVRSSGDPLQVPKVPWPGSSPLAAWSSPAARSAEGRGLRSDEDPLPFRKPHIVELEDSSRWQIFPGALDLTLNWKPETDLTVRHG